MNPDEHKQALDDVSELLDIAARLGIISNHFAKRMEYAQGGMLLGAMAILTDVCDVAMQTRPLPRRTAGGAP